MKKFINLFNKVGGKKILQQYSQGHVLLYALFMTLVLGIDKKSLEILRLAVNNKLLKRLRKNYKSFIDEFKKANDNKYCTGKDEHEKRKIWICWFQGIENAPDIVQKCYSSVKEYITDREIVLITEDNYRDYVEFPEFIKKKVDEGIISKTHLSDLLRLELLIRYGGTWMDATIFCTSRCPDYMLDSELFLFQNLKPGLDGHCSNISNWFITAEKDNLILKLTMALLYEYWNKNDKLVDYFIFHDFFQLACEAYSEVWNNVVPFSNSTPHILLLRLFEQYDETIWVEIKKQTSFHKLTYKFRQEETEKKYTYYNVLLN